MAVEALRENPVSLPERLTVTALVASGGAVVLWQASSFPGASGYFPTAIGLSVIILSAISAVWTVSAGSFVVEEARLGTGLTGLLLLGAFIWSAQNIGFLTSALWFLPAMAIVGGERRWFRLALMTLGVVFAAWLIFHQLFSRPLPPEFILLEK